MTKLHKALHISSRLCAAVEIGGDVLSIERTGEQDSRGADRWQLHWDFADGSEHTEQGLAGWGDENEMMANALTFLTACAEGRQYARQSGGMDYHGTDGNGGLFTSRIGEWAEQHEDAITMIACELSDDDD
jgi:hypothetical protein